MIRYKVGHRTFSNCFEAFFYASRNNPHEFPHFYVFDEEFRKYDWAREPETSWDDLLTRRAQQLREKYDVLILAFSGGTDSITIYNIFRRNKIFIDEITIAYQGGEASDIFPKENVRWLQKNHYDPKTKITIRSKNGNKVDSTFRSEDWIIVDTVHSAFQFDSIYPSRELLLNAQEAYKDKKWTIIIGMEKPHIFKKNDRWYATHLDKIYGQSLATNTECFYTTGDMPEIQIKQCHMARRYAEITYRPKNGWSSWSNAGKISVQDYNDYASLGCGRDTELYLGQSFKQKIRSQRLTISGTKELMNNNFDKVRGLMPDLEEKIKSNDSNARNFLAGFQYLQNDRTLVDYMHRHQLLSSPTQLVKNYNAIFGLQYPMDRVEQ
jgi:hypothetical protein